MKLIRPPALKRGDTVALVAPAGPVSAEAVEKAVSSLADFGLTAMAVGDLTARHRYLAGPDEERAGALQEAFLTPSIKAVFALRGGYGTMRILPLLDFAAIRKSPTVFVGSSDLTALLTALVQEAGMVAFHGPGAAEGFSKEASALLKERFWKIAGEPKALGEVRPDVLRVLKSGRARGRLMGGCLSLLASTVGTPWELKAQGAVLFIEDVGEAAYRIDRMLTQLAQSGLLGGVKAVVAGEMVDCPVPEGETWTIDDVILDRLGHLDVPIVSGFPAGHGRNEMVLPIGVEVELDTGSGSLTILEAAVS